MKHISLLVATMCLVLASGCDSTTPPDPAKIASSIRLGTSAVTAIGLVAIPNVEEADRIASLAAQVLDNEVLPLLTGDEGALAAGLSDLLTLSAFDKPELVKLRLILEAALPLLEAYLPTNLIDDQLGKIKPDVRAYVEAFFNGIRDGIAMYQGGKAFGKGKVDFHKLHNELAK